MRVCTRSRFAACVGATALLVACGTLQPPIATHDSTAATPGFSHYRFFSYSGRKKTFKVPAGVTHLKITLYGANGGLGGYSCCSGFASSGGAGGTVTATIPVTPGENLAIFVGGSGGRGGFNGGAAGAGLKAGARSNASCGCGGGGGASDVRQGGDALADRVLVAGGGGGGGADGYDGNSSGGTNDGGSGGYGGARIGGAGEAGSYKLAGGGGGGGTQNAGGRGGAAPSGSSCNGLEGTLGAGGPGGPGRGCGAPGGGGGGGYYGGGGGGAGGDSTSEDVRGSGGGGGGGSSFTEARATHVKMTDGGNRTPHGDGTILVFW